MSWKLIVLILVGALVTVLGAGYLIMRTIQSSEFAHNNDNMFGDQDLKTLVALVELHKVRYGRYPATLQELKFTGQWDQIALQSARYVCSPQGNAYYVEVVRGWTGKPTLNMPEEFWRGTGYSSALKADGPPKSGTGAGP